MWEGRTAATLLLSAGADVKDVQAQLRHVDATTTLNSYCAVYEGKRSELAARLDIAWRADRERVESTPDTGS
jgi:integrase